MTHPAVAAARGWIGTPYHPQASLCQRGADCLGLVRGVWREIIGPEPAAIPPYTPDWSEMQGDEALWRALSRHFRQAPPGAPQPGDVLLFRMRAGALAKHLGIQASTGPEASFIHAYARRAVVESPLGHPWARRIVARFRFPEKE